MFPISQRIQSFSFYINIKEVLFSNVAIEENRINNRQKDIIDMKVEYITIKDSLGRVKNKLYKRNLEINIYEYNLTRIIGEYFLRQPGYYTNYQYDAIGRLVASNNNKGEISNYSYDNDGNIVRASKKVNGLTYNDVYDYNNINKDILMHMRSTAYGKEYEFEYPLNSDGTIKSMYPSSITKNGEKIYLYYQGNNIQRIVGQDTYERI